MSSYQWDTSFEPMTGDSLGWAHHGITLTRGGELVAFHPDGGALLFVDRTTGQITREVPCPVTEAHDLIAVVDSVGTESIWVADCGFAMCCAASGDYEMELTPGRPPRVVQLALDGTLLIDLERPPSAVYDKSFYVPTAVALSPSGDIWVGDGYGASLVTDTTRPASGRHHSTARQAPDVSTARTRC